MEQLLSLLQGNPWFTIFTAAVTLASAITVVTPTPKPGTFLAKLYVFLDLAALNIGKAKDKGK
jgi:hypothetical protein